MKWKTGDVYFGITVLKKNAKRQRKPLEILKGAKRRKTAWSGIIRTINTVANNLILFKITPKKQIKQPMNL